MTHQRSELWSVVYHFKLVIFIHLKLNCFYFSKVEQTIKSGCLVACLWNWIPQLSGKWSDVVTDRFLWFFPSLLNGNWNKHCSPLSLSWTVILDCTRFLKQRVAIMQFTFVQWKNLVLFPPEQPHFIIAFCVSIRSIFSIYSLHSCPRRAVCVRPSSVGLALSQIYTTTHWDPVYILPAAHESPPSCVSAHFSVVFST